MRRYGLLKVLKNAKIIAITIVFNIVIITIFISFLLLSLLSLLYNYGLSAHQNVIKQVVCWRGHLTRIVGLEHVAPADVIVSASTDCSVR